MRRSPSNAEISRLSAAASTSGWSASVTSTASQGASSNSAVRPAVSDEASPLVHSPFITVVTDSRPDYAGAIISALAPRTTTTGLAPASMAAAAIRRTSGSPSCTISCFGKPNRVDAPAARTTAPTRGGDLALLRCCLSSRRAEAMRGGARDDRAGVRPRGHSPLPRPGR